MTTIVTRAGKGSALSWIEADANFINLNTDKAEVSDVALKAPLASPIFTGVPAADTAITGTNTTQLATTAFVQGKTATQTPFNPTGSIVATDVQAAIAEVDTEKAPSVSPTFMGVPLAPTAASYTSTTQIATTAFSVSQDGLLGFCKNKLFNGEVTRINQRAFAGDYATLNTWNSGNTIAQQELCYGYDMWAKSSATEMLQIIEAGNFRPSTEHTLSGTNVTTQQITSPASGNWTITVLQTARNVQVEEGAVATPFEIRPISFELAQCQRYCESGNSGINGYGAGGVAYSYTTGFKMQKRAVPFISYGVLATNNVAVYDMRGATEYGADWFCITTATAGFQWAGTWLASAVI